MNFFKTIFVVLGSALIVFCGSVQAREVTYLPRDYKMISRSIDYSADPYGLQEQPCLADQGTSGMVDTLGGCLDVLLDCPDCCLAFPAEGGGRPTTRTAPAVTDHTYYHGQSNPLYSDNENVSPCPEVENCTKQRDATGGYFLRTGCEIDWDDPLPSGVLDIAKCQELGCPGWDVDLGIYAAPNLTSTTAQCRPVTAGDYSIMECNANITSGLKPHQRECVPLVGDLCPSPYYKARTSRPCSWSPATTCWLYEFEDAFIACIRSCVDRARGFERYERDLDCFYNGDAVCGDRVDGEGTPLPPGFANNCVVSQCEERIDWPACVDPDPLVVEEQCCDNFEAAEVDALLADAADEASTCLFSEERGGGGCLSCFQLFGKTANDLFYDFVARSDQKVVVLSHVQASSNYCWGDGFVASPCPDDLLNVGRMPTAALYTMIKVFNIVDPENEVEVFPGAAGRGVVFQGAFSGSILSSGATVVSGNDAQGVPFLQQGNKYRVRLYWYLPQLDGVLLYANVTYGALTILQSRE